jgi:hypothetical protein
MGFDSQFEWYHIFYAKKHESGTPRKVAEPKTE